MEAPKKNPFPPLAHEHINSLHPLDFHAEDDNNGLCVKKSEGEGIVVGG
jgi:hypothetical protein